LPVKNSLIGADSQSISNQPLISIFQIFTHIPGSSKSAPSLAEHNITGFYMTSCLIILDLISAIQWVLVPSMCLHTAITQLVSLPCIFAGALSDTFIHHVIKEATLDNPLMVIFLSLEHNRFTVAVPSSLDTSLLQQSTIYNNTHQVIFQLSFICYNL